MQRNSLAAVAGISRADLRVLVRSQGLDAMGAAGCHHSHRHRRHRGPRHINRRVERIPRGLGARGVPSVRRLGAVCCGAGLANRDSSIMPKRPTLVLSALFLVQGAAFYGLTRRTEAIPTWKPLSAFPAVVGEWRMLREGVIEKDEKDVLRADDYLTRQYAAPGGKEASLF